MKKNLTLYFIVLLSFLLAYSCSKDSGIEEDNNNTPDTEMLKVTRYQIITFDTQGAVVNTEYDYTLDGKISKAISPEDGKISLLIPGDAKLGENKLSITQLAIDKPLLIEEVTLTDTPKNILDTYVNTLIGFTSTWDNSTENEIFKHNINEVKETINRFNENEKLASAKFYFANKSLYDDMFKVIVPKMDSDQLGNIALTRWYDAMYYLRANNTALWTIQSKEKIIALGTAVICLKKAISQKNEFLRLPLRVVDSFISNETPIVFKSEEEKFLSYRFTKRALIKQDDIAISFVGGLDAFFKIFDELNLVNTKLNNLIIVYNNDVPSSNLKTNEIAPLPESAATSTFSGNVNAFNKTTFDVESPDVLIKNAAIDDEGRIKVKLELKDDKATEPVFTKLIMLYRDNFNVTSKEFNIKVLPKNDFILSGTWKLTYIEDGPADEWISYPNSPDCQYARTEQYVSGTVKITNNDIIFNYDYIYKNYIYTSSCIFVELEESTEWTKVTANHNAQIINNILKITNGRYENEDGDIENFGDSNIVIVDQNTLTISYSFQDNGSPKTYNYRMIRQ